FCGCRFSEFLQPLGFGAELRRIEAGKESLVQREGRSLLVYAGFQRRTGLRAAVASSRRLIRVVWGALKTNWGSSSISCAIERNASMNASSSSLPALSVGSIIMAPGTMRGKDVV